MIKSGKLCQIATKASVLETEILLRFLWLPMTRVRVYFWVMGISRNKQRVFNLDPCGLFYRAFWWHCRRAWGTKAPTADCNPSSPRSTSSHRCSHRWTRSGCPPILLFDCAVSRISFADAYSASITSKACSSCRRSTSW